MQQFIVLPQTKGNPFNKNYIQERAETVFSNEEDANKAAENLAVRYHGITFHVYKLLASFVTELKVS